METLVPRQLGCPLPHVRAGLTVETLNPTARGAKRRVPAFQKHTLMRSPHEDTASQRRGDTRPCLPSTPPPRRPTLTEPCGTPHGEALPPTPAAPQRAGGSPAARARRHSPMSELQNASCGWMGTQVHASATRSRRLQLHRNTARKPSHAVMLPAPGCASSCSRCSVRLTRASPARCSLAPSSHRLSLGLSSAALARRHGASPSEQRYRTERG